MNLTVVNTVVNTAVQAPDAHPAPRGRLPASVTARFAIHASHDTAATAATTRAHATGIRHHHRSLCLDATRAAERHGGERERQCPHPVVKNRAGNGYRDSTRAGCEGRAQAKDDGEALPSGTVAAAAVVGAHLKLALLCGVLEEVEDGLREAKREDDLVCVDVLLRRADDRMLGEVHLVQQLVQQLQDLALRRPVALLLAPPDLQRV